MHMAIDYWSYGDVPPGPIKASILTDVKAVVDVINSFKNKAMVIGPYIMRFAELTSKDLIDKVVSIALSANAKIVTNSAELVKYLDSKNIRSYEIAFPVEFVRDVPKKGIELIMFIGHHYAYEWLILNHFKHFSNAKTLSLEPYAQPNATWSLPSLPLQIWYRNICSIEEMLRKK